MNTLKAEKRDMAIKAKKLRREGYVTGNVFGKEIEGSIPVKMNKQEVEAVLRTTGKGGQLTLEVDGQPMNVLVKEIAYNSMKRLVEEIDFQALVSGEKVNSVAEIVIQNHEMLQGGVLEQQLEEVHYRALPSALVEKVVIDAAKLRVGDTLHVRDLAIAQDPDVEVLTDLDAIVVTVGEEYAKAEDTDGEGSSEEA